MSWKVTMEVRFSIVLGIRILVDILKATKILSFCYKFSITFYQLLPYN